MPWDKRNAAAVIAEGQALLRAIRSDLAERWQDERAGRRCEACTSFGPASTYRVGSHVWEGCPTCGRVRRIAG